MSLLVLDSQTHQIVFFRLLVIVATSHTCESARIAFCRVVVMTTTGLTLTLCSKFQFQMSVGQPQGQVTLTGTLPNLIGELSSLKVLCV